MADGKAKAMWSHTSALMAMTANTARDSKTKPFKPDDFNPYAQSQAKNQKADKDEMEFLRRQFESIGRKKT